MSNNANRPIFKKQLPHGIAAAVFEKHTNDRTYRSVNLQRSYKKDGKWERMTIYLNHEQIPFFIEALEATWKFLNGELAPVEDAQPSDASAEAAA